jgi:hypothetical protein
LYVWTPQSGASDTVLKNGNALRWNVPIRMPVDDWMEVVGVYISRPPGFNIVSADTSVRLFEPVEGKTLHIVRRRYRDRKEVAVTPDTAYAADTSGEVRLLARGDAMGIVNPSNEALDIRVIRMTEKHSRLCRVEPRSIQIYRGLLEDLKGPVLAYTQAGISHSLIVKREKAPPLYLWLDNPAAQ